MKLRELLKYYFAAVSFFAHFALLSIFIYLAVSVVTENWRWRVYTKWIRGDVDKTKVFSIRDGTQFSLLPKGRWIKIHQQTANDNVHFARQTAASTVYDAKRGRILMFGSDIHGINWDNTIHIFDMSRLQWQEEYPNDPPESYKVKQNGYIVAGGENNRPGAMQVYGAAEYDELNDQLIVASLMKKDGYRHLLDALWPSTKAQPAWIYELSQKKWHAYYEHIINFYPYTLAYDSRRGVVTGFRPNGTYEWSNIKKRWVKVGDGVYQAWHTNSVYDSVNDVFLLYGGSDMKNDVHVYMPNSNRAEIMPTLGSRPPAGQAVPLAFHDGIGKMAALVDTGEVSQTWLYDYRQDEWQRLEGADFPYNIGINYCLEYDRANQLLVLISSPPMEETAVWVLRI